MALPKTLGLGLGTGNLIGGIPTPIQLGILRGVRTAVAMIVAGVAASIADGSLIQAIHVIPAAYGPAVTLALGTALAAIDKWLRERGLEEPENTTDSPSG